jgi:hypothetical protein
MLYEFSIGLCQFYPNNGKSRGNCSVEIMDNFFRGDRDEGESPTNMSMGMVTKFYPLAYGDNLSLSTLYIYIYIWGTTRKLTYSDGEKP